VIKPRKSDKPSGKWPEEVPGDTPLLRARYIAQQAVRELARYSGQAAEAFVRTSHAFGETWLTAHFVTNHDDWMSREQASLFAGVRPRTINLWVQRGHIRHYPQGYSQKEIDRYLKKRHASREEGGAA
jgi:hypothetical protein